MNMIIVVKGGSNLSSVGLKTRVFGLVRFGVAKQQKKCESRVGDTGYRVYGKPFFKTQNYYPKFVMYIWESLSNVIILVKIKTKR